MLLQQHSLSEFMNLFTGGQGLPSDDSADEGCPIADRSLSGGVSEACSDCSASVGLKFIDEVKAGFESCLDAIIRPSDCRGEGEWLFCRVIKGLCVAEGFWAELGLCVVLSLCEVFSLAVVVSLCVVVGLCVVVSLCTTENLCDRGLRSLLSLAKAKDLLVAEDEGVDIVW